MGGDDDEAGVDEGLPLAADGLGAHAGVVHFEVGADVERQVGADAGGGWFFGGRAGRRGEVVEGAGVARGVDVGHVDAHAARDELVDDRLHAEQLGGRDLEVERVEGHERHAIGVFEHEAREGHATGEGAFDALMLDAARDHVIVDRQCLPQRKPGANAGAEHGEHGADDERDETGEHDRGDLERGAQAMAARFGCGGR